MKLDKSVCDRIKAVLMYDAWYVLEEIAKVLFLSHEGIRKHFKIITAKTKLNGNLAKDEAIYFMDSVHPQYQTRARFGWIRKNVVKTLPSFSTWKRKHIIGAINLKGLGVITTDNPKINGEYIIEFLKKLEATHRDKSKVYLICDNAGYHKSKKVKEYLQNTRIEPLFLPPYSQNLNPIERL